MKRGFCLVLSLILLLGLINTAFAAGGSWICPNCNETRTTEYCSKCGAHRSSANSEWYCPTCGQKLSADDNFCPRDGTAKDSSSQKTSVQNLSDLPYLTKVSSVKMSGGSSDVVVYTGPGSEYYRSASGKAAVHKAATVSAFGRVDDWVLIRYDAVISSSNKNVARFAYAPADQVAGGYNVPEIEFAALPISISSGADLVDEPSTTHHYSSLSAVQYNNAIALAQITEAGYTWVYFETTATSSQGTRPFRGFVPIQYVRKR